MPCLKSSDARVTMPGMTSRLPELSSRRPTVSNPTAPAPAIAQPTPAEGDLQAQRRYAHACPADLGNRLVVIQVRPEPDLTRDCLQNRRWTSDLRRLQVQNVRDLHFYNWRRFLYTGMT